MCFNIKVSDHTFQNEAGQMGKHKDLSEFDKDQIVMVRPLDQSISKTAALVGCSWWSQYHALGNVLLGNLGSCHIHVDVTLTRTTYLSIVADHVHTFMETVFPDGCGLFQRDNAPCHKAKMLQEWFDEHNNEFEELTPPPNSPDLNPIERLWDVLDKQVPSMEAQSLNLQEVKDLLLTSWCQLPQHTFRDLVESMPRGGQDSFGRKRGTDNIRHVVIMLWLIDIHRSLLNKIR
ncbi:hypothetical protein QTP70_012922 [Hemibagrus guttatus]|uniref:Tc1-like transposase DDE domain-containing protein n=1 Tax=Hemibagrus guttatus TaxID=175788 RepID=A0AAE0RGG5_9TELE|nr:hypothetical protein QTP70_012922 [Hemibagrus guttatus]